MKHSIYFYIILASLVLTQNSCQKYLDIKPKGKDIASKLAHFKGLLNNEILMTYRNILPDETGYSLLGDVALPVFMSDDVFSENPYFSDLPLSLQNAYKWKAEIFQPDEDAPEWGAFYAQNYIYNLVINGTMQAEDGTLQQKKEVIAEARANRALMHFMLVNFFGKPYNPSTASIDPGVPIVTEADATRTGFTRESVKAVYDFIITELQMAIPDLPEQTISRLRLARSAGYYILGEVYFSMRNYEKALTHLNLSKTFLSNATIPIQLYDYNLLMNQWFDPTFAFFGVNFPQQYESEENIYVKQVGILDYLFTSSLYLKPNIQSLFSSSDTRLNFFNEIDLLSGSITLPGKMRNSPFFTNYGPSIPNLYLMLAESKARTGDISGTIEILEELRRHRMPEADAKLPSLSQDQLIRFILEERHREYAGTGMRWFDMRRLSQDPVYSNLEGTHALDGSIIQLPVERLVLKIPSKILATNPQMQDNP